jgi:hypothetical protein
MAVELPLLPWTLTAGEDLTGAQFRFVTLDTVADETVYQAGAGEPAVGVLQNNPDITEDCNVMTLGVSKVLVGTTVTAGEAVSSDANGKARPATGSDSILGYTLHAANAGEYASILLAARGGQGAVSSGSIVSIPVQLSTIAATTVNAFTPGFAGTITAVQFVNTVAATTAAKAATLGLKIGSTAVTGGAVALTSANQTPLGNVVAGSAVTALNTFTSTDTISVVGSGITAFVEGAGVLLISLAS